MVHYRQHMKKANKNTSNILQEKLSIEVITLSLSGRAWFHYIQTLASFHCCCLVPDTLRWPFNVQTYT